jgi:hypothetical protein
MKPAWKIDSSIYTAGFTAALTKRDRREGSIFRSLMDGNVRWGWRHWRTKSFNRPWSQFSTKSTKRIFGASHTVSGQDAASIKRWMR